MWQATRNWKFGDLPRAPVCNSFLSCASFSSHVVAPHHSVSSRRSVYVRSLNRARARARVRLNMRYSIHLFVSPTVCNGRETVNRDSANIRARSKVAGRPLFQVGQSLISAEPTYNRPLKDPLYFHIRPSYPRRGLDRTLKNFYSDTERAGDSDESSDDSIRGESEAIDVAASFFA